MKVHWTDNAEHHLDTIYNYIAKKVLYDEVGLQID